MDVLLVPYLTQDCSRLKKPSRVPFRGVEELGRASHRDVVGDAFAIGTMPANCVFNIQRLAFEAKGPD